MYTFPSPMGEGQGEGLFFLRNKPAILTSELLNFRIVPLPVRGGSYLGMAKASQRHERFMQNKSDNGCPPLATLPNERLIIVCEREPKSCKLAEGQRLKLLLLNAGAAILRRGLVMKS